MGVTSFINNILTQESLINNNYYNLIIIVDIDNHYHSFID